MGVGVGRTYRSITAQRAAEEDGMSTSTVSTGSDSGFELRFGHLFLEGRALAFPCDARGEVRLDALSERARANYLYARALVGREFAQPAVCLSDLH